MSFFDDSSLAFLPSGAAGKDGKAYSIKPTDGTGDFTFSRGSNLAATRVGADGLIEKGRENLILQSNQFDTTPWLLNTTSATSGQSGYDGTTDAWLLNSTGTGFPRVQQNVATSGVFVFSVYAKAATDGFMLIRTFGADAQVWFDLSDGSISNEAGAQYISSTIENIGNGWYRYSVLVNGSLTSVRIYPASAYGVYSTSGNGIYIQDSQVEVGTLATEVIESGASTGKAGLLEDEPRFDYSGGATCPSLLLEPSRTQYIPYTEFFDNAITNVTPTYNYGTSPDGLNNSTFLLPSTAVEAHRLSYSDLFTYASSTSYVASVFIKSGGHRYVTINLVLRNSGSFQESAIGFIDLEQNTIVVNGSNTLWTSVAVFKEEYANGFYRYSVTAKTPASGSDRVDVQLSLVDENGNSFAGNGTDGIIAYGLQAEQGSYPTSYIPNHSGGTITRGADSNVASGLSSVIGQTEGTIYVELDIDNLEGDYRRIIGVSDGTTDDSIQLTLSSSGSLEVYIGQGGTYSVVYYGPTLSTGVQKLAITYKTNEARIYRNGTLLTTDTSVVVPACSNLYLGKIPTASTTSVIGNKIKQSLLFDTALSDADCITLTT